MADKLAKNIVIWTLPRSGSTHLQYRISKGQYDATKNFRTRNLGEAIGIGGMFRNYWGIAFEVNFGYAITGEEHEAVEMSYLHWQVAPEEKNLTIVNINGNPLDEIASRTNLIRSGTWTNPTVMKNMRWSRESDHPEKLNEMFDRAWLEATGEEYYHIVLWRESTAELMASRIAMGIAKKAHGEILWNGKKFNFKEDFFREEFAEVSRRHFRDFVSSSRQLPANKTVLIETKALDRVKQLEWPDGTVLSLPSKSELTGKHGGSSTYIHKESGKKVKPIDMMSPKTIQLMNLISAEAEQKLSWSTLGTDLGFRSYL